MVDNLIVLVIGWFLGLLAPAIVDKIKSSREVTNTYAAIKSELNEVAYRMVLASYYAAQHLDKADHEFLKWVKDSLVLYQGNEPTENIAKYVEQLLKLKTEELATWNASNAAKGLKALVLVKFAVPFVDARVTAFHSMASTVQIQLLSIRADVKLLDDLVDQSRTYFHLTFGKLEGTNYTIVVENLRGVYCQYMERCRIAADRIHNLQSAL
jgi:hypothetical protein